MGKITVEGLRGKLKEISSNDPIQAIYELLDDIVSYLEQEQVVKHIEIPPKAEHF